jgi:quinol monooxygenase YgiN
MAIGVTAKLKVLEGKNEAFEEIFKRLVDQVTANEPACTLYALHKSREDAQLYIVLEQYTDEAALAAHGKTDYFRAIGKELAPCMAAAPDIEVMDTI